MHRISQLNNNNKGWLINYRSTTARSSNQSTTGNQSSVNNESNASVSEIRQSTIGNILNLNGNLNDIFNSQIGTNGLANNPNVNLNSLLANNLRFNT